MKEYIEPEVEFIEYSLADIISASTPVYAETSINESSDIIITSKPESDIIGASGNEFNSFED